MGSSVNRCGAGWTDPMMDGIERFDGERKLTLDDCGMSACFAEVIRNNHRYNVTAKTWMYFDGTRWGEDVGNVRIAEVAKEFVSAFSLYAASGKKLTEEKRPSYLKTAAKYGHLRFRQILINDASSVYPIQRSDLDRDSGLFNVLNCTMQLSKKHGSIEAYFQHPNDLLTKRANVFFEPEAKSELWERFLYQVMDGDTEKIRYLQRICGLCLTADTSLECLWLLYGPSTRNGKSTFVETMSKMMGDYALSTAPETLAQRKRQAGTASGDIARLAGCRLLTASEPPKKMLLDVALVKTLTGRDSITARHLYQREFQFVPEFKLLINTNSLPVVADDTLFQSSRVRVVEFPHHFSESEQDTTLKQKLTTPENMSGIFNWCLDGLMEFWEIGESPPQSVLSATEGYRNGSEKVLMFLNEETEESNDNIPASLAYTRFAGWCEAEGFGTDRKTVFMRELRKKGLMADTGTVNGKTVKNVIKGRSFKTQN